MVRVAGTLLTMLPIVGPMTGIDPAPALAAGCSPSNAAQIAASRYGGQTLSVTEDGNHFIVRLRLEDGQVIDVAIERDAC